VPQSLHIPVAVALLAVSASASAVPFLATDSFKLFWGDTSGPVNGPVQLDTGIQSLTTLPAGFVLAGANPGDIIANDSSASGGRWGVYVLGDPYGTPTLTPILSVNHGIGSMVFANGKIYGVDDSLSPIRIYEIDPLTGNSVTTYNTGVAVTGGGGLAYDTDNGLFYFTDYTQNRLYSWTPAGGAVLVGNPGFGFINNGLEYRDGVLWGALRPDNDLTHLRIGFFNLANGAFTTTTTVSGIAGGGTGFVVVPEPMTISCLALAATPLLRKRRR